MQGITARLRNRRAAAVSQDNLGHAEADPWGTP